MPAQCQHTLAWCKSSVSVSLSGFQVLRKFAWQCDVDFWKSVLCLLAQSVLLCICCVPQQCCSSSVQLMFSFTLNPTPEAPPCVQPCSSSACKVVCQGDVPSPWAAPLEFWPLSCWDTLVATSKSEDFRPFYMYLISQRSKAIAVNINILWR